MGSRTLAIGSVIAHLVAGATYAQDADEMARKLQDPLGNIKAIMTDNGVDFKTGDDETSYTFQIQPVYAIPFEEKGFNFITRGVFPILGIAPEGQKPVLGEPLPKGDDHTWGLGDSSLQFFFSPRSESAWKWGAGPVFSLPTHSDDKLTGAGWGAGPILVLVGSLGEDVSLSLIGGHLWGDESGFSTSIMQPMLYYNVPGMEGVSLSYNNTLSYNWNTTSGNEWTIPLGAGVSKTIAMDGGHGLDLGLGLYYNVERPEGAADYVLKWSVTVLFP